MRAATSHNSSNNGAPSFDMDYCRRSICFAANLVLQRQPREEMSR
jgi:hypothetical protein